MTSRVIVVGAGVGGLCVANRLARSAPHVEVTLLDGHDDHIFQPGLVYVPLGVGPRVRPTRPLLRKRVSFKVARAAGLDLAARRLETEHGESLAYDALVVATGSRVHTDPVPGFKEGAYHFHCRKRAAHLYDALLEFDGGDLVVGACRSTYKCPAAPVEFALLLQHRLRQDGRLERTRLHIVSPSADVYPRAGGADLTALLTRRGFTVHAPFEVRAVDPEARELVSDQERLPYDMLVLVPPHTGAPFVKDSGLANEEGWIPCDPHTLRAGDGVYVLGDAAALPAPKLGSAAHGQARTVVRNVLDELSGRAPSARYDGRATCLYEAGRGRVGRIDTRYGRDDRVRRPGRLRWIGKRAFGSLYFRMLSWA